MNWHREMEEAAVRIAFPTWELRDDDEIEVRLVYDEGYYYSEYTMADPSTTLYVEVTRSTYLLHVYSPENDALRAITSYTEGDLREFFYKVMVAGTSEEVKEQQRRDREAEQAKLADTARATEVERVVKRQEAIRRGEIIGD